MMQKQWKKTIPSSLTTQSEFQSIKQENANLKEQNEALKQSLNDLIKINNELTDSMQSLNSAYMNYEQNMEDSSNENIQLFVERLGKKADDKKVSQQGQNQIIIEALQKMIDSFSQIQVFYESQVKMIADELQGERKALENKLKQIEDKYLDSLKVSEELIGYLRKKQEIINKIDKKITFKTNDTLKINNLMNSRRIMRKSSEKDINCQIKQSKSDFSIYESQITELKIKERQLVTEIQSKNKTIALYTQLFGKIRNKLLEKY